MRVRRQIPQIIKANPHPSQIKLFDPLRIPRPMVQGEDGTNRIDPNQRQCSECGTFFSPKVLANGKLSPRKVCSSACEHKAKRRNVKARRVTTVKTLLERQDRIVEEALAVRRGLADLLRDVLAGSTLP